MHDGTAGLSLWQRAFKRGFDVLLAMLLLVLAGWLIPFLWVLATIDTRANGLFLQERIGRGGRTFQLAKIRTMRVGAAADPKTTVTVRGDARVTRFGAVLRKFKLDEMPQLVNVLRGEMSFVGPRPDVPGFADHLESEDRIVLQVRPGITGPATVRFRAEEELLAGQADPERYNREVIWPEKVRINAEYVRKYRFSRDLEILFRTLTGFVR